MIEHKKIDSMDTETKQYIVVIFISILSLFLKKDVCNCSIIISPE